MQGLLGALLATLFQAGFHLVAADVDVLDLGPACRGLNALQFKMERHFAEGVIAGATNATLDFLQQQQAQRQHGEQRRQKKPPHEGFRVA